MKTIGIAGHSAEGAALCFLTAVHEGETLLGPHMHPNIVSCAIPMGLSMPGWESGEHAEVAEHLLRGVEVVARAGADFFVCPDNTAHIVLDQVIGRAALPGLHIAQVVCAEAVGNGWRKVGLTGTRWTMTGSAYEHAMADAGLERITPSPQTQSRLNTLIFEELCRGVFRPETTAVFVEAIEELAAQGAECVILGCTEIPIIINADNSPLPVLDSTRLLGKAAARLAVSDRSLPATGWIAPF
ncbi:amino acid racemase [Brevundimonas sp. 2R-24]|uniref:Amino acid racemase n=1 Tax=Peiella sedimenti TaxID=3061083 RepID=A0ABT8SJG1_9CAUL|nr:amino acid racemase [Caulobacteraceae bacterium XZ-24]